MNTEAIYTSLTQDAQEHEEAENENHHILILNCSARTAGYEPHTERHLTRESCSAVRLRRRTNMTERFVVLPVAQCRDSEERELNHHDNNRELSPGFGGEGDLGEPEAVPILQYSREPNKYGE
ncbi:hypothetical protein PDJAM_G00002290 [Pangasius djambal]|uniref:Uncharacterized protein n=1 Tax=Pangasius djambal TaxID=1691987 RepID=A0ACC5XXW0_9TELE|nr:hypothetical protein [Pangasius djambal]